MERIISIGYTASDGGFSDRLSDEQIAICKLLGLIWQGSAEAGEEFALPPGWVHNSDEQLTTSLTEVLQAVIPGVVVTVSLE